MDAAAGRRRGAGLLAVLLAMAMFVLVVDTSLMNVSISAVVEDLDTTVSGVQSAIALEALVSAAFILISSKIGDLIGRRRAYVLGLLAYAVGALAMTLAQNLLAKHKAGTRQIIMISDGEPTAHLERGRSYFAYPPSPITIRETLKEVKRATQKGIVINTFMLDRNYYLKEFVNQVAKINKGRVFYTTPDKLGQYILVDYVQNKRKNVKGT